MRFPFHLLGTSIASHQNMPLVQRKQPTQASSNKTNQKIRARKPFTRDAYRSDTKPAQRPVCKICGAINIRGSWVASNGAEKIPNGNVSKTTCPACQQQRDQYAEAVVELHGDTWQKKRDDVWRTILKTEEIARSKNDQQRLISTRNFRGITKVYVTLPQLARHLGRVLGKSFKGGKVEYHLSSHEPFLRVIWKSDPPELTERRKLKNRSHQWRHRGARR